MSVVLCLFLNQILKRLGYSRYCPTKLKIRYVFRFTCLKTSFSKKDCWGVDGRMCAVCMSSLPRHLLRDQHTGPQRHRPVRHGHHHRQDSQRYICTLPIPNKQYEYEWSTYSLQFTVLEKPLYLLSIRHLPQGPVYPKHVGGRREFFTFAPPLPYISLT